MQPPVYTITTTLWLWEGKGAWYFVSIPPETSREIKEMFGYLKAGWGSIPVILTINNSTWKTSLFPDTKNDCFIAPIKAEIRSKEKLQEGDTLTISITGQV
jgi:Domain of unknown function (DUF1905)